MCYFGGDEGVGEAAAKQAALVRKREENARKDQQKADEKVR